MFADPGAPDHAPLEAPEVPFHLPLDGATKTTGAITSTEADLLAYLAARPLQTVPRSALMASVWGAPAGDTRAVDTMVRKLRRKVERDPQRPDHLMTVHGEGFRFVPRSTRRSGLFGRTRPLDAIGGWLEGSDLVTITGPGGIGKTAIARAAADRFVEAIRCDLAPATTARSLVQIVAAALGLAPTATASAVAAAIRGRRDAVVVLDNLEQLEPGAAAPIAAWSHPAGAKLLCTSRSPLGLSGEVVVEIGPLDPDAAAALFRHRYAQATGEAGSELSDPDLARVLAPLDGSRSPSSSPRRAAGPSICRPSPRCSTPPSRSSIPPGARAATPRSGGRWPGRGACARPPSAAPSPSARCSRAASPTRPPAP